VFCVAVRIRAKDSYIAAAPMAEERVRLLLGPKRYWYAEQLIIGRLPLPLLTLLVLVTL